MPTSSSIVKCLIDERPEVLLKLPSIVEQIIPWCTSQSATNKCGSSCATARTPEKSRIIMQLLQLQEIPHLPDKSIFRIKSSGFAQ